MDGKLIIFSAPSGSGKTTIVKHLLGCGLPLEFSVSACTREPRSGEVNGKDYYFIPLYDFRKKVENGEFVEWEEVYPGLLYGTLKSEIERIWKAGKNVIFDVDVAGGINLKNQFGKRAFSIFVMPPSVEELENRLKSRGTDAGEDIRTRIEKAHQEIKLATDFDLVLVNDDLDEALKKAFIAVNRFLKSK
ncbi:MAG: guanylate kinase [Bacteroides sp. SM23_62_1]|nr:MAG: guanylate kinase [Bacteroides sp. SM23_62_1]